jgi:hypothetical protein
MTRRITVVRRPGQAARRLTADARVAALRFLRQGPGGIAGQRGAWRPVLAAIPVLTLVAVIAYAAARGKLIPPKIKFSVPERTRPPDRQSIPRNR